MTSEGSGREQTSKAKYSSYLDCMCMENGPEKPYAFYGPLILDKWQSMQSVWTWYGKKSHSEPLISRLPKYWKYDKEHSQDRQCRTVSTVLLSQHKHAPHISVWMVHSIPNCSVHSMKQCILLLTSHTGPLFSEIHLSSAVQDQDLQLRQLWKYMPTWENKLRYTSYENWIKASKHISQASFELKHNHRSWRTELGNCKY